MMDRKFLLRSSPLCLHRSQESVLSLAPMVSAQLVVYFLFKFGSSLCWENGVFLLRCFVQPYRLGERERSGPLRATLCAQFNLWTSWIEMKQGHV